MKFKLNVLLLIIVRYSRNLERYNVNANANIISCLIDRCLIQFMNYQNFILRRIALFDYFSTF